MVNHLLADLASCPGIAKIVITQNTRTDDFLIPHSLQDRTHFIRNDAPKGFGENHNAAFLLHGGSDFFCVLNPDIRLVRDPFPGLLAALRTEDVGLVAPLIVNSSGQVEDSARRFPTPLGLLRRTLKLDRGTYLVQNEDLYPEWVAGMFMLFKSPDFKRVQGFDEGFFLYCEDIDICLRLAKLDRTVLLTPREQAIHDAQRGSRRHPTYLAWHIGSLWRLWRKHARRALAG